MGAALSGLTSTNELTSPVMLFLSEKRSSIAEYINAAVTPHIPCDLISPHEVSNISRIASLLPGNLTNFFGFECPLGVDEPRADFLVCCRASHGAREVLCGLVGGREFPSVFQSSSVWRQIYGFSSEWASPLSPLFDEVHNLWLEFDVDGMPRTAPIPSVFIGADHLHPLPEPVPSDIMPPHCAWLTDFALPKLLGAEIEATTRCQIARTLNLLPSGARIFQVGLMLARDSRATRLCIRGMAAGQIGDYLHSLGWDGSSQELQALLTLLEPLTERIDLDLDVSDRVMPKIGLECYFGPDLRIIQRFLNQIVSSGLSTSSKAKAIELWPGLAHERLSPSIWPRELLETSSLLGGRLHSLFARWLHHVKIVYQPGVPLQAKAYLAVQHLWLAPADLKDLLNKASSGMLERKG